VSVVVPTYDRDECLRRAVESVARQTYDPVELVVVDDCSPTPARTVLAGASLDPLARVECIRHEENRGANAARNTGIGATTGEFVAFLDDDDRWAETKLERQVETFRTVTDDVGVVYTGTKYLDARNEETLVVTPTNRGWVTEQILHGEKFGEFSVMMVRASVIEAAGLPDERFPSWQDREWLLRLSRHCKFEAVTEPLTLRDTNHGAQISDNYEAKRDVSYPLFLAKHRSLAAEYGWLTECRFVAAMSAKLGQSAVRNDQYRDARRYLATSFLYYPVSLDVLTYLVAALGGKYTYRLFRQLAKAVRVSR